MMLAKLWCDHAKGFVSGLRASELDVGDWEGASGTALADAFKYTVMMNTSLFSWEQIAVCRKGFIVPDTLETLQPCQLEIEQVLWTLKAVSQLDDQ